METCSANTNIRIGNPYYEIYDYSNSYISPKPCLKSTEIINYYYDRNENKRYYTCDNYKAINDMSDSPIGSSMESHISHYIANLFSSIPKGYS